MTFTVQPAADALDPRVWEIVAPWLPGRRWFPGGSPPAPAEPLLVVGSDDDPRVQLVLARLAGSDIVVHVPLVVELVETPTPVVEPVETPIAVVDGVSVYDGGTHPACWLAILGGMGIGTDPALVEGGRVVSGEQSNTSVILPGVPSESGSGGMLKILRTVASGPHPDVVIPQALTDAGWDGVPRFLGALEVGLPVVEPAPVVEPVETTTSTAHLAVLAELVPDARDGFELACDLAASGTSFAPLAADLGRVLAGLHATLRTAIAPGPALDPRAFVAGLRRRATAAIAEAPTLATRAPEIVTVLDDLERRLVAAVASSAAGIPTQSIHGDLHLGQALHGTTGWKLLDFEGEPQRPVAERSAPDLPLRDVAGMLRSFGYAAAVGRASDPSWEADAADAFLSAYRGAAGPASGLDDGTADAVLRALVLDKALYEVVYETRQRPDWVTIPLAAVDRSLGTSH